MYENVVCASLGVICGCLLVITFCEVYLVTSI
jgi:hypothetical protein